MERRRRLHSKQPNLTVYHWRGVRFWNCSDKVQNQEFADPETRLFADPPNSVAMLAKVHKVRFLQHVPQFDSCSTERYFSISLLYVTK